MNARFEMAKVVPGSAVPRRGNAFTEWLGRAILRMLGWRIEGVFPDVAKAVMVAAPHTSNWDGAITLATTLALRLHLHWMGKESLFRWPFRRLLLWMGGIPVQRGSKGGLVQATAEAFAEQEKFLVVISPEGTRSATREWKSGFYQIAHAANVPILLAYVDFHRKVVGFGPLVKATGSYAEDIERIRAFYDDKVARHATRFEKT